jgi:hypothetical protein
MVKNPRLKNLQGKKFGRLLVKTQAGNAPGGAAIWLCLCSCGNEIIPSGCDLRAGKVMSCGCARNEITAARNFVHGEARTRLYMTWKNMKRRCAGDDPHYGGKGVKVCKEWLSFPKFSLWAKKSGYADNLTIERIAISGDYTPKNCTWIPSRQQAINRSNVARRKDGKPWLHIARENGISDAAYRTRVFDGWDYEQASSHPMFKRR